LAYAPLDKLCAIFNLPQANPKQHMVPGEAAAIPPDLKQKQG
jgi:hypothetical protein